MRLLLDCRRRFKRFSINCDMKLLQLLQLIFCLKIGERHAIEDEWDQYDDEDLALSIPNSAMGEAAEFRNRVIKEMSERQKLNDIPENRCYCNYGPEICGSNATCVKHDNAACYHSVEEIYNKEMRRVETWHKYGCAGLERGSGASHFTCNSWRTAFKRPHSIGCCYRGNYCNRDLKPPPYAHIFPNKVVEANSNGTIFDEPNLEHRTPGIYVFISIVVFFLIAIFLIAFLFFYSVRHSRDKKAAEKKKMFDRSENSLETGSTDLEKKSLLIDDSGSGSGKATLIQRTVRQNLTIISSIGQGRYGQVRKALYRGSCVAVKTFYTTDEDSWQNERDVYQTHMINHENILQFVAADIWSEEDSMTKMLLVTDYHELGSLCDYLRREKTISNDEALRIIYSCICGIEHLHTAVQGTGTYRKPEIAHRDIKSKNIIVKRPGVCCIADLGLALRYEDQKIIPSRFNVQVGTKRYMAPELLAQTLNPQDFSQFKMADIYSMGLVMWEVAIKVEDETEVKFSNDDECHNDRSESSGFAESSSSDGNVRIHQQTSNVDSSLKVKPYIQPFEGLVEGDPSMEQMRDVICVQGLRPPIEPSWQKDVALHYLSELMRDSWHANPQYRHSSLKLKKEMIKLMDRVEMANRRSPKNSVSKKETKKNGETSKKSDSGINSLKKSENSLTS